ncbi:MAG: hypothetical protein GF315_01285 [candidate division Zixibacteria bacterium]|nr:hypothetical protein [candidate division Zixibacteria bacterium]
MSKRKGAIIRSIVYFFVVIGIVMISGCGKLSPVSSDNEEQKEPFGAQQVEDKWGRVFYWSFENAAYGWVDEGGGNMEFEGDGYEAEFIVPDNAVSHWEKLWMEGQAYYTESGMVYIFEFGPEGLQFSESATLLIEIEAIEDYDDDDEFVGAELSYYNPDKDEWETVEWDDDSDDDGYYEFEIDHFSRYGIGGRTM